MKLRHQKPSPATARADSEGWLRAAISEIKATPWQEVASNLDLVDDILGTVIACTEEDANRWVDEEAWFGLEAAGKLVSDAPAEMRLTFVACAIRLAAHAYGLGTYQGDGWGRLCLERGHAGSPARRLVEIMLADDECRNSR
jgi:hypothetical protein